MPRNMSFSLTTPQMRARTKDVTRRMGWNRLQIGEELCAVVKGMGLKKGEQVERIGPIRVVSVRREPLNAITPEDCVREGFPEMTPAEFVAMFCKHNGCAPDATINRIEFEHLPGAPL